MIKINKNHGKVMIDHNTIMKTKRTARPKASSLDQHEQTYECCVRALWIQRESIRGCCINDLVREISATRKGAAPETDPVLKRV